MVIYFVVLKNLTQWKHVDVKQKRPQDGALGNSACDFVQLRFAITYRHKEVPVF